MLSTISNTKVAAGQAKHIQEDPSTKQTIIPPIITRQNQNDNSQKNQQPIIIPQKQIHNFDIDNGTVYMLQQEKDLTQNPSQKNFIPQMKKMTTFINMEIMQGQQMKNFSNNVQNDLDNSSNNQINNNIQNDIQNDPNDNMRNSTSNRIQNDSKNAVKGFMKAQSWILKTKDKRMIRKINLAIDKLNSQLNPTERITLEDYKNQICQKIKQKNCISIDWVRQLWTKDKYAKLTRMMCLFFSRKMFLSHIMNSTKMSKTRGIHLKFRKSWEVNMREGQQFRRVYAYERNY